MRKRRSRYTWFPIVPTALGDETPGASWYDSEAFINTASTGRIFFQALNLVPDFTIDSDEVTDQTSLRDAVEGQEYVVERIVGRLWGGFSQSDTQEWYKGIISVGICVPPYEDNDNIALNEDSLDPLGASNSDASWLYRQVWPIYNNLGAKALLGPTSLGNSGPDYGFVDTRSVRRIHKNERLTIVCSMHMMDTNDVEPPSVRVNWGYDLRVLGQMRKAIGQSTFT